MAIAGHRTFSSASGGQAGKGAQHPNIGTFSSDMQFVGKFKEPFVTYRVLDDFGNIVPGATDPDVDREKAVSMFRMMVRLNVMDSILYEAQRQGRLSFYMTNYGEEAIHMGSAAALTQDDVIFGQYREAGVLLWRGFTIQEVCDQCVANEHSSDKGRMMPVHYGSARLNFQTISSPLGTQLPQAAGAAYSLKMQGKDACVVCYFGDGAASEGDFHGGLNFAATLECPVVFFCRNNGYAISTPISEQYKGDGIAVRGVSYNIETVRCDGNDVWAVYNVMKHARHIAVTKKVPVLVEAMTYRGGHHSTSDDATRYRGREEVSVWANTNNPIARIKMFLERKGWVEEGTEEKLREEAKKEVLEALVAAEAKKKLGLADLFTDVYDSLPPHLREQEEEMRRHLSEFGDDEYPVLKEMR
uniref:2-oxoisovalerate dehydrogenase subunit alpha n=1 Tax=Hemiselmis andersenii TaxID=464988 RepID=A0A6U5AY64_HEMAN